MASALLRREAPPLTRTWVALGGLYSLLSRRVKSAR